MRIEVDDNVYAVMKNSTLSVKRINNDALLFRKENVKTIADTESAIETFHEVMCQVIYNDFDIAECRNLIAHRMRENYDITFSVALEVLKNALQVVFVEAVCDDAIALCYVHYHNRIIEMYSETI